ncbi:PAS domain S-box protein [Lacrimispora amygdalina]|uniref:PAS domain S-box protein n=1 Tax=Lacrimispora amygdalina TaxID=253257 RepID=A0A3E2NA69_9FIRM|nr:HD domain-containing phosphohydrolase [Clostridium indicum]RFZ77834.1 PAS domain S-box protein [Clostridium indicum]
MNHHIQNTLDILPYGIGYLRLLVGSKGEAVDYVPLAVNSAFETLTGWQGANILGERDSETPGIVSFGPYWLTYFECAIRSGQAQETTQWIEDIKRYLKITVIPDQELTFTLILREASDETTQPGREDYEDPLPEDMSILFDKTHDAISLVEYHNGGFRFIRNNALHQRLTGVSNIHGVTPVQLAGEEVGAKLETYYEQCLRTSRPVSYEQSFQFEPGHRVWQTEVTPVFSGGTIRYLLCSSKDVSELKKVQGEKEVLAQRLNAMFDRHTAIMLIVEPFSGKILDANPAACEFYGYSKEEFGALLVNDINTLPPEEVKKNRMMTYEGKRRFFTLPHRLKNGDTRLVDICSCPISDGENTLLYSIIFDVTDREIYREELYTEKEMLRTTLRSIGDGVVTTDNFGVIGSLNDVAQEMTGWTNDEAKGKLFTEVFCLLNEETGAPVENPIRKVLDTGRIVGLANHTVLANRHGQYIPIADSAAPIQTENGETFGVVMVFRDVSVIKEHSRQIEFLSDHDPLTGLFNRRYVEKIMDGLDVAENLPISVIIGDVNGLKITNDVFGPRAGDTLLQNVTSLLKETCNSDDLIARWGGDEFVVFMLRTSLKDAEEVVHQIMDTRIPINGSGLLLSMSLGCASKEGLDIGIEDVMREAEESMYHKKLLNGQSYRNAVINTLLATLYEKSNETEEHSNRMERHCHSIGRALRLSSKEMAELSLLALLHDIGKVGIHLDILRKPGPLTSVEWEEMKRHPEIGCRIAQATPELSSVADLILAHHERWDGTGYPYGLKEEEIPLACRILAVTDAYDAMTNDRTYRAAKSREDAISELLDNAGSQFDPEITTLFIDILHAEQETDPYIELEDAQEVRRDH